MDIRELRYFAAVFTERLIDPLKQQLGATLADRNETASKSAE